MLHLSHEVNGKIMQPEEDPFQFVMEIDRLAAELHRLSDRPITKTYYREKPFSFALCEFCLFICCCYLGKALWARIVTFTVVIVF